MLAKSEPRASAPRASRVSVYCSPPSASRLTRQEAVHIVRGYLPPGPAPFDAIDTKEAYPEEVRETLAVLAPQTMTINGQASAPMAEVRAVQAP